MTDIRQISDWDAETEKRVSQAASLFREGYNCSQAVSLAFADLYGIPEPLMARLSASFGGGIGRMRETCGAACGMFLLAGLEEPSAEGEENSYPQAEAKKKNYEAVQRLAEQFRSTTGSLLCRELLGLEKSAPTPPTPEARTPQYYAKRPCSFMVETGVRTFMSFLRERYQG